MRKVRQDGGIRYHVNMLQAMVSIHKRLSAGKLVTGIKRGKTCKNARIPELFKNTAIYCDWSDHFFCGSSDI